LADAESAARWRFAADDVLAAMRRALSTELKHGILIRPPPAPPTHHTAPPFLTDGIGDYLPAVAPPSGKNNTDAISPDTMRPS
jgi:hypothetical protein